MKRETVVLDGTWSVVFDDENVGEKKKYFEKMPKGKACPVPGVWELVRPEYDGVGWYERLFEADATWLKRTVRIHFGAVNYYCDVYLNGEKIGQHEGGYTPFEFDITQKVKAGKNRLSVRVINPPRRKVIQGFRTGAPLNAGEIPTWKAGWYWNFGGIWQTVKLVITDRVYVEDVFVEPLPDKKTANVHVTVVGKKGARVALAVGVAPAKGKDDTGGAASAAVTMKGRTQTITVPVKIRNMRWWDTETPYLYVAKVDLESGAASDSLSARFGMRTFTVKDGHFVLNGKRVVLKGVLQQSAYPRTLAFPDTPEMLRKELELVKKGGMNFIRIHLKPDPFTPDLADEMGILCVAEPPAGWIRRCPEITRRCLTEVEGLVKRDRNHPSIVMWCMLNEIYHFWTFSPKQMDALRYKMSLLARKLDPTRIVGDNSGGAHEYEHCAGALMPYRKAYSPLQDLHHYSGMPMTPEGLEKRYRNWRGKGPFYISEFGAWECPPDWEKTLARYSAADRKAKLEDYVQYKSFADSFAEKFKLAKLEGVFGKPSGMIKANDTRCCEEVRSVVSAMRVNPTMDGYAICQLADASGEIFGLTDIWRQPKPYYKDFVAAGQTPWIVPHLPARTVDAGGDLPLVVDCVNEHTTGNKYRLEVVMRPESGGGKPLSRNVVAFTAKGWTQNVLKTTLAAPKKAGRYVVEATLKEGEKTRCVNTASFVVVEPLDVGGQAVVLVAKGDSLRRAALAVGANPLGASNSAASKKNPFLLLANSIQEGGPGFEIVRQVSRQVRLGGVAVLFEPATPLYYDSLLPSIIRQTSPMRTITYVKPHPIVDGLPTGVADYAYGRLLPGVHHDAADVVAAGGESIIGGIGAHMWTRPDVYLWTSMVDEIPIGRGRVLLVRLRLLKNVGNDPVARRLMANIIRYAAASIKPGLDERSVGRYMDPVTAP